MDFELGALKRRRNDDGALGPHSRGKQMEEKTEETVKNFSLRRFLRSREALLIHFNTPQSTKHRTGFPEDLRNAMTLRGKDLAFSTIQVGDRGPSQVQHFEDANAGGSVGIVVDIEDEGSVLRVCPDDGGTNESGEGFGTPPSESACAKSIDERVYRQSKRNGNNEWRVQNYIVRGIFVFLPIFAFIPQCGDIAVEFERVLTEFPNERIFTVGKETFQEYDRATGQWMSVNYSDIVPC